MNKAFLLITSSTLVLLGACVETAGTSSATVSANPAGEASRACTTAVAQQIGTDRSDVYAMNQIAAGAGYVTTVTTGPMQAEYDCQTDGSGKITAINKR